jgi:Domain of Unknown Function with PDB structure (DUF3857)/Transglutaminase-like superfamily
MRRGFKLATLPIAAFTSCIDTADAQQPIAPAQAPFTTQYESQVSIRPDLTAAEVATKRIKIMAPSVVQALSQLHLPYVEGMQTIEIVEAFTEKADGRRIPVKADGIITQDAASGLLATYLRDLKQKVVIYPDVAVGDTLVLTTKIEQLSHIFPAHLFEVDIFPRSQSFTTARVTIEAPAALDLQVKATGGTDDVEVAGDIRRHTVSFAGSPYRPEEAGAVSPFDRDPVLLASTFKSYEELGRAFGEAAAPKAAVTPEIAALAEEITQGITDRKQQAAAIDAWMKKNIRYVAVYLALGRVVPHDAATVLAEKFGDCKDKVTLMSALLAAKGIASEEALINLGNAYTLPQPPTLATLNHVILYLPEFDLYDDPTVSWAAFGVLSPEAYDKPVVHVATGAARLAHTPAMRPQDHVAHAVTKINVAPDGTIRGETRESNTGIFATGLRLAGGNVQALGSETAALRQLQGYNTPGTGRFDLANITETVDPAVTTGTFTLTDHFKAPAAGSRALIPFGMPLSVRPGLFLLGTRLAGRQSAFVCYAGTQIEDIEATFAPGLPLPIPLRPTSIDNPFFSFHSTFTLEARTLKIHRELVSRVTGQACPAELEARITNDMNVVRTDVNTSYAFNAPSLSPDVTRVAVMDQKLRLDFWNSLNPDCSSAGYVTVRITEQAQHGSVAIDHGTGFSGYGQGDNRFDCNNHPTEGTIISYAPEAGFTGADSLTIEAISPTGGAVKRHYQISIYPGTVTDGAPEGGPAQSAKPLEYTRVASSDQVLQLAFLFALNPDCSSLGYATVRVLEAPKHGKLAVEQGTGFSTFPQSNQRFACNKRRTDGVNVAYTPEAGYVGADSMLLDIINADGSYNKRHYAIEVK